MSQTEYVRVKASDVSTFSVDVPDSGYDTTSGYYIRYEMSSEGGFSGMNWYWDEPGNPLVAAGYTNYDDLYSHYVSNGGNLTDIFRAWLSNSGEDQVHNFCNYLWSNARACISLVG